MAETAALLVEAVLPRQPMRQWGLSVPFPLLFLFASHLRGKAGYTAVPLTGGSIFDAYLHSDVSTVPNPQYLIDNRDIIFRLNQRVKRKMRDAMSEQTNSGIKLLCLLLVVFTSQAAFADKQVKNQLVQAGLSPDGLSKHEWGDIQQQILLSKYSAVEQHDGSYVSANIANGWHINFGIDGRTTLTPYESEDHDYFIGLQLKSLAYGGLFAGQTEYDEPQEIVSDNSKLTYQWSENLKEVWTNSNRRLEQWFEIKQRPQYANQDQPLKIQLELNTDLPVAQSGNALNFANKISYSKLKVWDSTGAEMPARMHLQDKTLLLVVDDRLAIYPLTVDPDFQQHAYLKASNTGNGDQFGHSVAISGDTLVVGAFSEDSDATGVDNDGTNDLVDRSGAAYVFARIESVWSQQAYLKASNTGLDDRFGESVAISGDTLVVGAMWESSNAKGINGAQDNDLASISGAAYVFIRTNGEWSQQAYLKASNTGDGDQFGYSIALSGDTLVVGAPFEDGKATGVDGDQDDDTRSAAGAAYVFTRTESVWSQQAYLKASNTDAADRFGESVALSGDTVVVGAFREDSNDTGVNGDGTDNLSIFAGAAYVFTRTEGDWNQQAYLKASNTGANDNFGISVAVSGDTLVVGANIEGSNAKGVNGGETNDLAAGSGAAYVFTRIEDVWSQQAYLKASNTESGDSFGRSVAISGDTLMVATSHEDSNATGIDGNEADNSAEAAGAAYVFSRTVHGVWGQQAYVKASNTEANDWFGGAVAISGDFLLVGAVSEDSNAMGANGDQANNDIGASGAVYVFRLDVVSRDGFE
jgi:hypothetical protein